MSSRRAARSRNSIGLLALGLVLAADAALGVWAWHRYRSRQDESRSFDVVEAPMLAPVPEDAPSDDPTAARASAGRDRFARASAASPEATPRRPTSAGKESALRASGSDVRAHVPLAEMAYRKLKREPRFRGLSKAWTDEFIRHQDLRRINHQYWQDRDALRFVVSAVQSPSFLQVLTRFSARPDLVDFIRRLSGAPGVGPTLRWLLEDPKTSAAIQRLQVAGLPSVGAFSQAGRSAPDAQKLIESVAGAHGPLLLPR